MSAFLRADQPATRANVGAASPDIVYRSDETDATAQGLADQPQFSGVGIVAFSYSGGGDLGKETVIYNDTSPAQTGAWALTAAHVVTADYRATPAANSVTFSYGSDGAAVTSDKVVSDYPASDLAVVHFPALPNTPAVIPPNVNGSAKVQPVGAFIWNVGYGNYDPYTISAGAGLPTLSGANTY